MLFNFGWVCMKKKRWVCVPEASCREAQAVPGEVLTSQMCRVCCSRRALFGTVPSQTTLAPHPLACSVDVGDLML